MIEASALNTGMDFEPSGGASLTEAWRQAHFAAQVAAEVGKSWAVEKPDDSHSTLGWVSTAGWHGLEGVPAAGPRPCRARLGFAELELRLDDGQGGTIAHLALPGHTLGAAMDWLATVGERELGPRRQPSRPAPDLPDHPIAGGAAFEAAHDDLGRLADLYAATAGMLAKLREVAPAFDAARCWPHHFDLASLAVVATDDAGAMTRSVGVGVTPPDSVEPAGYWYVSPWIRDGASVSLQLPRLSIGRWVDRGGVSMALLPVSELSTTQDRPAGLSTFIAEAVTACMNVLDPE